MNTAEQSVITLLKSALTQQPQPLPEDFSMEALLSLTKSHHIIAAIYEGAALCGVDPADPAMQKLFPLYCKALQVSVRQMQEIHRVCRTFDENGIDYMPLKGSKMKALYPKPELRMMGDADILIRVEQYEKIKPVMQALGFQEKYESDHELVWTSDGLFLELHKCLIPTYNKDFYAYFADGWQLAKPESGVRYTMSAEDELIFLFTHFAKHYRDGGIGCRYVADLWLYLRAHPEMDQTYICDRMQELKLLEFYQNILQLIAVWFEDATMDEKTDFISSFIFASGSWGSGDSNKISLAVRDTTGAREGRNARASYIWGTLFPKASAIDCKYTILKKHPWMLPLVWVWRPFYKVLFERKTLKTHKKTLDLISQERVDSRRDALHYVGLDYHF